MSEQNETEVTDHTEEYNQLALDFLSEAEERFGPKTDGFVGCVENMGH